MHEGDLQDCEQFSTMSVSECLARRKQLPIQSESEKMPPRPDSQLIPSTKLDLHIQMNRSLKTAITPAQ